MASYFLQFNNLSFYTYLFGYSKRLLFITLFGRTATTHIKRQLISGDNSDQIEKATTHIKR